MQLICKNDRVVRIPRTPGVTVTCFNNDPLNDVYVDTDRNVLLGNNVLPGGIPGGVQIKHGGGSYQIPVWSEDYWARAVVDGTLLTILP